jgi:hypothetical protein
MAASSTPAEYWSWASKGRAILADSHGISPYLGEADIFLLESFPHNVSLGFCLSSMPCSPQTTSHLARPLSPPHHANTKSNDK